MIEIDIRKNNPSPPPFDNFVEVYIIIHYQYQIDYV